MEGTLRASVAGLERVDQARKRRGWNRQSVAWAEAALTSVACLKQFWRRERISRETFGRICEAAGITDWQTITDSIADSEITTSLNLISPSRLIDWGEAPELTFFCGREKELHSLEQWILTDRCKLVALLGMGGLGKTSLTVRLVEQLESQFEVVIWRSLRNAPTPEALVTDLLRSLSDSELTTTDPLVRLMQQIRSRRCLLVLDNAESILGEGDAVGHYPPGYEDYGDLLRRFGEERHSSCLVLTSREQPRELTRLAGERVRSLHLGGLPQPEARQVLQRSGSLDISEPECVAIVDHYAGNPLALKIVAAGIRDLLASNVSEFLDLMRQDRFAFADIRDLLERHFARLSAAEQTVMFWLAIAREPVGLEELKSDLLLPESCWALTETLESLKRRSMIEVSPSGFSLQPAVMEFVTQQLTKQIFREISQGLIDRLRSHALIKVTGKDYIRTAQIRLILEPVLQRLQAVSDRAEIQSRLLGLLPDLQGKPALQTGYVAGNVLNLLGQLGADLKEADFSDLTLWQADLRVLPLHRANFANADLSRSALTETFSNVLCVAFSPDGERLAKSDDRGWISLWQVETGNQLLAFQAHNEWGFSVAFSPDGATLATASLDSSIKLWDAATGAMLKALHLHSRGVSAVSFCPTDRTLLASSSADQTLRLIDCATGTCRHTLTGHQSIVRALCFAADGCTIASASLDCTVKLWEVATGKCLHTLETDAPVHAVIFVSAFRLASAGGDGSISVWDTESGNLIASLEGHNSNIWSLALTTDGALVSSGDDRTLKLWDLTTGRCLKTFQGHQQRIWSVAANPQAATIASGSDDKTIRFWNLKDGQCYRSLQGYHNSITPIAFSEGGEMDGLLTFSADQKVRFWDEQTGECLKTVLLPTKSALQAALSPDRQTIASGSLDCTIRLCDLHTGRCLRTLHGHTTWVRFVVFSPDGSLLASAGGDRTIKLWQVETGDCLHTLQGHLSPVHTVAFHPDRPILASGSWDRSVRIWHTQTDNCLGVLAQHTDRITDLCFTPTGEHLLSSSHDGTIRLWNWQQGECLRVLEGHEAGIWAIALSPEGRTLASISQDQVVRIWSLDGAGCDELPARFSGNSLRFSPNGQLLAIGSEAGTCRLWDLQHKRDRTILQVPRPYEGMNITRVQGLTPAQVAALKTLGAVEL